MSTTTRIIRSPYKEAAKIKNGTFQFSFPACLKWMEMQGKTLFGSRFMIFPEDHRLIYKLLVYAIGDRENSLKEGIDPGKGILLTGPVGCGKTSLMTLTSYFCPPEKQFQIKPTRELSFQLEEQGYGLIHRYGKEAFRHGKDGAVPIVYCFDDLGVEQLQKYFGNECNVIAEIILSRYDLFVAKGMLTHATTNLSASELEAHYGMRIRSRMREMFNLVAFDKSARDKRG